MFGRVSGNLCWYFVRCPFSEYKSLYCLVGKESVSVCIHKSTFLLNHQSSGWVTVFVMLTSQWFLLKETKFAFFLFLTEGLAFGILLPADLIGSVQPIYFCAEIRPPLGNKFNYRYKITAQLRWAIILRLVLQIWRDLRSQRFQWKTTC